jgi:plasmid stabilization system protein ParE
MYTVIWSDNAEEDYSNLIDYLLGRWGLTAVRNFEEIFDRIIIEFRAFSDGVYIK